MEEDKNKVKLVKFPTLTLRKEIEGEGAASLTWAIRAGYPRITVYTSGTIKNPDGTTDYTKIITAPFDYLNANILLTMLEDLVNTKEPTKKSVDCFNAKYEDNVKTNEVIVQAKVTIGKDDNGVNYIAVTEEGKRKIKFELLPSSKWFKYYLPNGAELTDPRLSSYYFTKAYVQLVKHFVLAEVTTEATPVLLNPPRKGKKPKVEEHTPPVTDGLDEFLV